MSDQDYDSSNAPESLSSTAGERKSIEPAGAAGGESALTRREMIKLAAGAVIAAPLIEQIEAHAASPSRAGVQSGAASQTKAPAFFTKEEYALVDELTEIIIPADDHSPGARAAGVAAYIDKRLGESFEQEPKQEWRDGLKLVESLSKEMSGRSFLESTAEQRVALLTRMSQNEMNPTKPEEKFFRTLKHATAAGYYSSKVGIHSEIQYKGNVPIKDFVGYDAT